MTDHSPSLDRRNRWARFTHTGVTVFHSYASWLVSISWWRFLALALLLLIGMGILHDIPPLSWTYTETLPAEEAASAPVPSRVQRKSSTRANDGVDISISERGVHITSRPATPAAPALPVSASAAAVEPVLPGVTISVPPGTDAQAVHQAVQAARREFQSVLDQVRQDAEEAAEEAGAAAVPRTRRHKYGEPLMPLTMWFILLSGIIKISYKGKVQAEARAAQATEVAESEALKRQVVEARMAAMQAQVEPHFLFNTLASIDHLIETDPPRASLMQKNLIALLRASMPTMREANAQGTRELGRELAVIRPYLEILKVRMEDRLRTEVRVSDGLLSAEFPPMMLQSLVENAIKHGLEPKADGGQLTVSAEIVHGKLAVTVADTGLGFGKAATAGTGIGLSNIRERLALLYGGQASLQVAETPGGGTSVTITVPYVARAESEQPS